MSDTDHARIQRAWEQVRTVNDPELPFLNVEEMGMVRSVKVDQGELLVTVTPTYSGCPATEVIQEDVSQALEAVDTNFRVVVSMSPAWTTDWIQESARAKMLEHGIAPTGQERRQSLPDGTGPRHPMSLVPNHQHQDGVCVWEHRLQGPVCVQRLRRAL